MKYRLNYDFGDQKRGDDLVADIDGDLKYYFDGGDYNYFYPREVNLLVLSGALTPIQEEKIELPEELKYQLVHKGDNEYAEMPVDNRKLMDAINGILRYLKSKGI